MTTVEAEFDKFDWAASDDWKTYLSNLYPVPPAAQLTKYKRKFYKSKINPELADVAPAAPAQIPRSQHPSSSQYTPAAPSFGQRVWAPIATITLACAICCAIGSLLPLGVQPMLNRLTNGLLALGLIAGAISENGIPKMNVQSWHLLCYNSHVQALALLLVGLTMNVALTIYSPTITAVAFVAKQMNFHHPILTRLVLNKPYLEIMVGVVGIYAWLTGSTTFMSMVLYWNSLRLLFAVNAPLKRAFANVNAGLLKVMAHPRVPRFIGENYRKASDWIWSKCEVA